MREMFLRRSNVPRACSPCSQILATANDVTFFTVNIKVQGEYYWMMEEDEGLCLFKKQKFTFISSKLRQMYLYIGNFDI